MEKLIRQLTAYRRRLPGRLGRQLSDDVLDKLYAVYPFNKFEYLLTHLIAGGVLTLEEYRQLRADYLQRNRYLHLFELAPRTFGETWGQRHLMELVPELSIPSPRLDSAYEGEYDLLLGEVRVEVKASRAVRKQGGSTLAEKALASSSRLKFDMNYQQLKPSCCDVFVWMAVWRDKIDYWVLPSAVVQEPHDGGYFATVGLSPQHRKEGPASSGEKEIFEGQIHINQANYAEFEPYRVGPSALAEAIARHGHGR